MEVDGSRVGGEASTYLPNNEVNPRRVSFFCFTFFQVQLENLFVSLFANTRRDTATIISFLVKPDVNLQ